jgi:hypothetical protein
MWEPDPSWTPLRGAAGPSAVGLWLAEVGAHRWIVKRLAAPEDQPKLLDPRHAGYWRREAEVAQTPQVVLGPGLVPAPFGPVEEDDEGLTIWTQETVGVPPSGLFVARALGRFAGATYDDPPWAARHLLHDRLTMAEERGGWRTLARTPLADVTDRLWQRRWHWLERVAEGPVGRMHGDAVPANLLASTEDDVVAVDWQCFGVGPVGTDLGYYALSSREEFDVLLEAFVSGVGAGADVASIRLAAEVTAVYSVITRAEWALAQAARGEGALAGKFRHPAVAPYVRALQRQFPQIEELLA